jgi:hypothetical protein
MARLNTLILSAPNVVMEYVYLGDRHTDTAIKNKTCNAVRRLNGKCKRGKNGAMLVVFEDGKTHVIIGRLLRKVNK